MYSLNAANKFLEFLFNSVNIFGWMNIKTSRRRAEKSPLVTRTHQMLFMCCLQIIEYEI